MSDSGIFDKMFEMGMGMTMANQIPRMMNQVINDQNTPPQTPPQLASDMLQIYAAIDGKQVGPLNEQECITMIQKGMIADSTLMWKAGYSNWVMANQIPEMGKLLLLYKKE